ncbi:MAG: molybdopterin-guanine dinucleotide biosynthesis protein B [Candidatus Bathyarchaeia archaeon]
MPRVVVIVGFKGSGKTSLIEKLIEALKIRGNRVGVIKHTLRPYPVDTPGKDTWRYREAGSQASALITPEESAIFLRRSLELNEAISRLGPLDLVLLEGFKELDRAPRIIVARDKSEVEQLRNGLEVAVAGSFAGDLGVRILDPNEGDALADIVEKRAMPLLPGLNCRKCGYPSCKELAKAVLAGDEEAWSCVNLPSRDVHILLDGAPLGINPFVGRVLRNVVMGVISTLKDVGTPESVELKFTVEDSSKGGEAT